MLKLDNFFEGLRRYFCNHSMQGQKTIYQVDEEGIFLRIKSCPRCGNYRCDELDYKKMDPSFFQKVRERGSIVLPD
jgi:hypothetical protein